MTKQPIRSSKIDDFGALDFTVSKLPLFTNTGGKKVPVAANSVLVRDDSKEPIAVVGNNFGIVQNRDLFGNVNEQIKAAVSPADMKGVFVFNKIAYNGKFCIRDYFFPAIGGKKLADENADLKFRILVVNGFGGSSLSVLTGAVDMFCHNGMMSGEIVGSYVRRHTKNLTTDSISEKIKLAVDSFPKMIELYNRWSHKKISDKAVIEYLKETDFSSRLQGRLFDRYVIEKQVRGGSVWALYSALTYFSSHGKEDFTTRNTNDDHSATTMLNREKQVLRNVRNAKFSQLAA